MNFPTLGTLGIARAHAWKIVVRSESTNDRVDRAFVHVDVRHALLAQLVADQSGESAIVDGGKFEKPPPRDRLDGGRHRELVLRRADVAVCQVDLLREVRRVVCLLYTSDAADE